MLKIQFIEKNIDFKLHPNFLEININNMVIYNMFKNIPQNKVNSCHLKLPQMRISQC